MGGFGFRHFYLNRARKSRRSLQNKVRINVVPVQLTRFVNPFLALKIHYSIVYYYMVLIIAQ